MAWQVSVVQTLESSHCEARLQQPETAVWVQALLVQASVVHTSPSLHWEAEVQHPVMLLRTHLLAVHAAVLQVGTEQSEGVTQQLGMAACGQVCVATLQVSLVQTMASLQSAATLQQPAMTG